MEKNLNQISPPTYSEPEPSDVDTNPAIYTGASNIMTRAQIADIGPPPAYDSILVNQEPPKTNVRHDDRNLWEKVHEWFEMSILQQIIWLGALVLAISYIVFGLKYDGNCSRIHYDGKGKKVEEIDLPSFMKAEGGVLCAYILFVFGCRLLSICDTKRKQRIKRADVEGRKKCEGNLFFIWFSLSIASSVLCSIGASKVIPFYKYDVSKNYTFNCDSEFYSFYHNAKIGQLVVFVPYAAYILIAIFIVIPKGKVWFVRRKWRQWASLLDSDQDGIISIGDMEKINARLDALRRAIGDRTTALDAEKQKKWWNDHIFKRGVNKDISIDGYINYLEGIYNPADMEEKMRPVITGFFNFFTTPDFRKKNLPFVEEDFIKFWTILTNMDELHCKRLFIRHFLNPLTMASFLEDFVAFLAYNDFFDENTTRVHNILKPPRK